MSDKMVLITGGCLCGEIRYETDAEPLWVSHCHCSMCRKHTGAALYVIFPAGTVNWLKGEPKRLRSSKDVERSFCPTCGSTKGFHRAHETSLHLGSLDQPDKVILDESHSLHVMYQDRMSWFDTADNWQRYERFPPGVDEELDKLSGQPIKG